MDEVQVEAPASMRLALRDGSKCAAARCIREQVSRDCGIKHGNEARKAGSEDLWAHPLHALTSQTHGFR